MADFNGSLAGRITETVLKGEKGDSPVRGVDYWTEEDQTMIVQDVCDTLGLAVENNLLCAVYDEAYEEEING